MKGTDYKNFFTDDGKTRIISGIDLVEKELQVLLQFPKHSLFFGNDLGLDTEKYLHLTNRDATFNLIKQEIENLFRKYPKAYLRKITMSFNHSINAVEIMLEVITDTGTLEVSFTAQD